MFWGLQVSLGLCPQENVAFLRTDCIWSYLQPATVWSRFCSNIYKYMYLYIYMYMCKSIYIYIYIYMYIYIHTHININMCMYMNICIGIYKYIMYTYIHTHTYTCIYIHTHTHVYIYIYTYIYMFRNIHIYHRSHPLMFCPSNLKSLRVVKSSSSKWCVARNLDSVNMLFRKSVNIVGVHTKGRR